MGAQETKELVLRFYEEVFNSRRLETFDELVAEDATDHGVPPGYRGDKAGSRSAVSDYLAAFPDLKLVIEDVIASEDRVAVRARWSGTNDGPLIGFGAPLPATGRRVEFETIEILGVRDGKLTDHWQQQDDIGLATQLGMTGSAAPS